MAAMKDMLLIGFAQFDDERYVNALQYKSSSPKC